MRIESNTRKEIISIILNVSQKWVKMRERREPLNEIVIVSFSNDLASVYQDELWTKVGRYKRENCISGMYTNYVCSKDHLRTRIAWRAEQNIWRWWQWRCSEKLFFTTLTVSTNALVSLCDDTAEQRQLLSESKRYGEFIYPRFKNSRWRISVPFLWKCRIQREDFSLRSCRRLSLRRKWKFSSQPNSTRSKYLSCRDGRNFVI